VSTVYLSCGHVSAPRQHMPGMAYRLFHMACLQIPRPDLPCPATRPQGNAMVPDGKSQWRYGFPPSLSVTLCTPLFSRALSGTLEAVDMQVCPTIAGYRSDTDDVIGRHHITDSQTHLPASKVSGFGMRDHASRAGTTCAPQQVVTYVSGSLLQVVLYLPPPPPVLFNLRHTHSHPTIQTTLKPNNPTHQIINMSAPNANAPNEGIVGQVTNSISVCAPFYLTSLEFR
jgi:hypothetical protein